ncbi:hypothetical protein L0128_12725 [candidate division KSB1 bacterium]|nr:hypothetical protein [candidate division KSB1 bacterium]
MRFDNRWFQVLFRMVSGLLLWALPLLAQSVDTNLAADTTKNDSLPIKKSAILNVTNPPSPIVSGRSQSGSDIVLEEIKIEAVVETPSVNLVPKRMPPEFGKAESIDRSFESELKAIPLKPMLLGNELNEINKIQKNAPTKVAPEKKKEKP